MAPFRGRDSPGGDGLTREGATVCRSFPHFLIVPPFAEKLTHLFFSTCRFHCFVDGNKRIAIVLCAQMLRYNGYLVCAETFLRDTENIAYHVAAGKIDKELLRDYLTALLNGTSDDEELKLRIIHAISDYLPGQ
ncbi:MAG: Fic family protein [Gemmatimonadaceae bacterium]